jgi:hypothetical protein
MQIRSLFQIYRNANRKAFKKLLQANSIEENWMSKVVEENYNIK